MSKHPVFNEYQLVVIRKYGGGDYSYYEEFNTQAQYRDALKDAGDTLFTFLMSELSTIEGADTDETAAFRVQRAIEQLQEIAAVLPVAVSAS